MLRCNSSAISPSEFTCRLREWCKSNIFSVCSEFSQINRWKRQFFSMFVEKQAHWKICFTRRNPLVFILVLKQRLLLSNKTFFNWNIFCEFINITRFCLLISKERFINCYIVIYVKFCLN